MRKRTVKLAACALALAVLAGCAGGGPASQSTPAASESAAAPESVSESAAASASQVAAEAEPVTLGAFSANTLDGEAVDETIFSGYTLTVVNVWATFCGWCVDEMPVLSALGEEYAADGVQIIGIVNDTVGPDGAPDESQIALAQDIVAEGGATYKNLALSEDLLQLGFANLPAVPATLFFDGNGYTVGQGIVGAQDEDGWRALIEERLAMAAEQMEAMA